MNKIQHITKQYNTSQSNTTHNSTTQHHKTRQYDTTQFSNTIHICIITITSQSNTHIQRCLHNITTHHNTTHSYTLSYTQRRLNTHPDIHISKYTDDIHIQISTHIHTYIHPRTHIHTHTHIHTLYTPALQYVYIALPHTEYALTHTRNASDVMVVLDVKLLMKWISKDTASAPMDCT